jgi:glycine/D-amino acid oxidase-like deaminating enzyme
MINLPDTEKSYWRESYPSENIYPELLEDVVVDVAVIGAGITGMTAAYLLKKSRLTVAVLEKHTVGGGTTGRTTGKVTSQHNIFYDDLQKRLGAKTAATYGEANQAAIEQIETIISAENISCDWYRDDNYVFTADSKRVGQLKQEAETASRLGLPASFETTSPLPFEIKAAVKFSNQGKINTQKYVLGLARAVNGNGSYVFEHSNVIGIREGNPGRIRTKKAKVIAKNIIVASSVPTLPLMARASYSIHEYPSESYLVAGHTQKDVKGMYISPDKEHYSIMPTEVDGQRIVLIGGEGHIFGLRGNRQARFERLAAYAEKHFGVETIANRWSDRDYLAYDGVPLVGKLYPWSQHLYVGTGFKKWGLTNGTAAGMILRDLICGNDNTWAPIFSPRKPTLRNHFR